MWGAKHHVLLVVILICICDKMYFIYCLENGLARVPPMGWMPFERFRCMTDCTRFPKDCISERLMKRMADLLVSEGYAAAGYEYLIMDDCWMETSRDEATHELIANTNRFPSGMNDLGNYIHELGLKFGIYHSMGRKTCMFGGPGAARHIKLDAHTFANWGVDYVKMDGCFTKEDDLDTGYPEFGRALISTGRPIVYSCSWPFYKEKVRPDFKIIAQHCNLWRFADDVQDSASSVIKIIMKYSKMQTLLAAHAGPGRWNDLDMLVLGNYRMSYDASRLQLAIWTVVPSPLIMTNDLESVRPEIKELLLNQEIIAINQDSLGRPGKRIMVIGNIEVWVRPVNPVNAFGKKSIAVAFVNMGGFAPCPSCPQTFNVRLLRIGLNSRTGYSVMVPTLSNITKWMKIYNYSIFQDLFNKSHVLGLFKPKDVFSTRINPEGVTFYKFTVLPSY
ncbi:hypothetical protein KR018_004269 [Drosophila ironensis]|nr:hypothetical protein KR018_004269 [Drosophila ironensis]